MQPSMAMMPLNKHVMRFMWRVSQKITCSYTSANKNKKAKKTNMIFHNPWSKCIQLLCQLEDPQFTIGFTTKWLELPRLNAGLVAGWQHRSVWNETHQPLEFGSSSLNIDHSSFCLKANNAPWFCQESQFLEHIVWSWLMNISCTGVKFTRVGVTLRFETQSNKYIIKLQKNESP